MIDGELIVDSFAGGGGASTGIEMALGVSPDIAINHDPEALAMHAVNHPNTRHFCEDVWKVDPREVCEGKPVGLFWLSPDCKHFSKAKGGKPVSKKVRGLAWLAVHWAKSVRPRVICLENGLEAEWSGSVWLNPPFSSKRQWYERLVEHGNGIALMPSRTETLDLQNYMSSADALLFLRGRIYFERGHRPGANGNGATTTPPFGIVLCAYGATLADALLRSQLLGVRAQVVHSTN